MSALSDVQREIDRMMQVCELAAGQPIAPAEKRYAKAHRMQVRVGIAAEHSIIAVTGDEVLPETIDDVPVVRVDDFTGFEVVVL
jgi:hypothetical protein